MLPFSTHFQEILKTSNSNRFLAIDVFRGIAITAMILVNNPGSWSYIYAPLKHAQWHGWTPTDLIFPFFIIIVGISISLSLGNRANITASHQALILKALIRAFKLFMLGLFLAAFYYNFLTPDFDWWQSRIMEIRIPGVLQRISIVYFVCFLLALYCSTRTLLAFCLAGLLSHTGLMLFWPYSDAQNTYVGLLDVGNNFAAFIDNTVFNRANLYNQDARPFAFDPEGIVSTLPAIVSGTSGVIIGRWWLQKHNSELRVNESRIKVMLLIGAALCGSGALMDYYYPINKALWTAPFVILTTGFACLLLAGLVFMLDIKRWRHWSAPFIVFGANSLLFFMFAGIVARIVIMLPVGNQTLKSWLYNEWLQPVFGNYIGSLFYAMVFMLLSYLVFYILYKQRLFWKV